METEIELKFLIKGDDVDERITQLMTKNNISFTQEIKQLTNCYFDTPELALRKLDMGLRVRRCDHYTEQTIKTAGTVCGGMHQRPEYNIEIHSLFPDLHLFPNDIWPQHQDVAALQSTLTSLFTTDFKRKVWLLSFNNGDIVEMVLDQGEIIANGQTEQISELELELVNGDKQRLLEVAYILAGHLKIRPGIKSKAARGYALVNNTSDVIDLSRTMVVPLQRSQSIGMSCIVGLQYVINKIQQTVELYMAEPSHGILTVLTDYLALIRHGLWLYKHYLPAELVDRIQDNLKWSLHQLIWLEPAIQLRELTSKSGYYRRKIEYSQALVRKLKLERRKLPHVDKLRSMFYSTRFNNLQLDLLQLLMLEEQFQSNATDENELLYFSAKLLDKNLLKLIQEMPADTELTCQQYLDAHRTLVRSLLTGFWFGNLYEESAREGFRNPWFDLKQGIDELETLWFLKAQIEQIANSAEPNQHDENDQPEKLAAWLDGKISTLMAAMEQSRQVGLKLTPYWR